MSLQDELLKVFASLPEDGGIPIRPLVDAVQQVHQGLPGTQGKIGRRPHTASIVRAGLTRHYTLFSCQADRH